MLVEVLLGRGGVRRWHLEVLEALGGREDVSVRARLVPVGRRRDDTGRTALLAAERALHRTPAGRVARVPDLRLDPYAASGGGAPSVVLDLAGEHLAGPGRSWQLEVDGQAGEPVALLLTALLHGRCPQVSVVDTVSGERLATGRPGSELFGNVPAALHDLLAGCTQLVAAAVEGRGDPPPSGPAAPPGPAGPPALLGHVGRTLLHTARHAAYRRLYRAPHWRVGWRFVDGPDVVDLGAHPAAGWQVLPDDGHHFYADPFPVDANGTTYLFVEDYDHRVGRGVISAVGFDDTGPVGAPEPVLETDVHLSYPFVTEAEGCWWMIPETSAARTVELYRTDRLPGGWVRERVLLEGVEASDATVFHHGGRLWMTATVRHGGSWSDALHLWSAPRLTGPWRPHRHNPVLLDIAQARPAGRVVRRGDRLVRPVQDGRTGYGAALALAEITRLDDDGYAQRVVAALAPGDRWPGRRLHTLNRAGRLECIDGSALSPRLPFLPKGPDRV